MGWRAWDAYDREAHERWKALHWRERYSWRGLVVFALIVGCVAAYVWTKFLS